MITSRQNRLIKDMRHLRRSKGDRALLEGPHLIGEALTAGVPLETVLATSEFVASEAGRALATRLDGRLQLATAEVLATVADSDSPRGILATALLPAEDIEATPLVAAGIYVYGDGLQEPGNLGALARVAEATGVAGLILGPGSAHPNHPRAQRAAAGSLLRLPVARDAELDVVDRHLAPLTPSWLALVPRGGEHLFECLLPETAIVLLVGAEGRGLSPAAVARADRRLTLPMCSPVESLNATVSAALALYELSRRR